MVISSYENLEQSIIEGDLAPRFLLRKSTDYEYYPLLVRLSEKSKDPQYLMKMVEGLLKQGYREIKGPKQDKVVVGIGSASLNVLCSLDSSIIAETQIIFIDNDPESIEKSHFSAIKVFWPSMFLFTEAKDGSPILLSWGGVHHGGYELAILMTLGSLDVITSVIGSVQSSILVACLGGTFGSGAICVIASMFKHFGVKTRVILQIPYGFESYRRLKLAKESLEIIRALLGDPIVLDPKEVFHPDRPAMDLKSAFLVLDREMAQRVERCRA